MHVYMIPDNSYLIQINLIRLHLTEQKDSKIQDC